MRGRLALCLAAACLASCGSLKARFPATGPDGAELSIVVSQGGRAAARGKIPAGGRATFRFEPGLAADAGLELLIVCAPSGIEGASMLLEPPEGPGGNAEAPSVSVLPLAGHALRYRLPLPSGGLGSISFMCGEGPKGAFLDLARMDIGQRKLYGLARLEGGLDVSEGFLGPQGLFSRDLLIPEGILPGGPFLLELGGSGVQGMELMLGRAVYGLVDGPSSLYPALSIPLPRAIAAELSTPGGAGELERFLLREARGAEPLPSDPAASFLWPLSAFRHPDRELFSWDIDPRILIIHFRDYAAQDRMLKRLAFYVEKAGFRGRLAPDAEIAGLHAWNAHDYRPADLAEFYSRADRESFPLNEDERALADMLLRRGIIREGGAGPEGPAFEPGEGALLSVARESGPALGLKLMAHEAFHGIYFTDAAYRQACAEAWDGLGPEARELLLAYFSFMEYDTGNLDLMRNELGSYLLQQPLSQLPAYLQSPIASRLSTSRRFAGKADWPALARKATAEMLEAGRRLDALMAEGWGLGAGRAWRLLLP